ncbi:beta-glucosidase BglX [Paraliobacillus sp. JSM ZJ581]|uniref:beta-glucosidase BglX n=1 Tax=Paraliobacillus sp. JSM ZJ581 TaxID=3342118 RepID=UPI0035A92A49
MEAKQMTDVRVTKLLEKMTLDEKIDQLMQLAAFFYDGASSDGEITGPMEDLGISKQTIHNSGSVLGGSGAKEVISIQKEHLKTNRLGIPLLIMADIIHGFKTIFPVPLAIGSSWDVRLAEKSAEIAALEASVAGVHVTFAPMVDLVRDPRWGRVMETTGEDPFLNGEFAKAFVRGFQGENVTNDTNRVAACVKHFAAYGAPEGGRDYNTVNMSERDLRENYLPAYKAALDAGAQMVMTAFNTVDGIPASGNEKLMRELLRDEWGFDGVVISDWGAIKEMIPHGIAADESEAAKKGLKAGVDIEMMTSTYVKNLQTLVEQGGISEELINESVRRILQLKEKLGLFENPYRGANEQLEEELVFSEEHRQIACELATKSSVLLKNKHVLPLDREQKVALIGPFAHNGDVLGPWSWAGSRENAVKVDEGIKTKIDPVNLIVAQGCDIDTGTEEQVAKAVQAASTADVIVLALGERSEMSGEAGCRADIRLPQVQLDLIKEMKKLTKPIAIVLFNGRPLDLHGVLDQADAVLEAWYPGSEAGTAIADLLYGDVNPSGKLPMSFPYSVGQVPVYYNHYNTGRPDINKSPAERYVSKYLDIPNEPLLPFGFGLSYTTFQYSDTKISSDTLTSDSEITISTHITNTGNVAGEEVVQLYVRDMVGEVVRPIKELKGYEKVHLNPGEKKEVTFILTEEQLRYFHADLSFTSDPGKFTVFVGPNSVDGAELTFELIN